MVKLQITVDERGVKEVRSHASNISEATRVAALQARIAVGIDLISRLAVQLDSTFPVTSSRPS